MRPVWLASADGTVTVVRNGCNGVFEEKETVVFMGPGAASPDMDVVMGEFCPEYPNELGVAASSNQGQYGVVALACGNGTGAIAGVPSSNGQPNADAPETDYRWGWWATELGTDIAPVLGAWPEDAGLSNNQVLYVMRKGTSKTSILSRLAPLNEETIDVMNLYGKAPYVDFSVHTVTGSSGTWQRGVFVGPEGFGAVQ